MTFPESKSSLSINQTIVKMMSILGLMALTNSAIAMELQTETQKAEVIAKPMTEANPTHVTFEEATQARSKKKKSHKYVKSTIDPINTAETTPTPETVTPVTPTTDTTTLIPTASDVDATDNLQTLLTELQTVAQAGSTGCLACLAATPSFTEKLAKDILILTQEAVKSTAVITTGIAEIMDLINTLQHFNTLETKKQQKLYAPTLQAKLNAAKEPLIQHNLETFTTAKMMAKKNAGNNVI